MFLGAILSGVLLTGEALADPPCEPITRIGDYDTDDIIWLTAGPYAGVASLQPGEGHLRVLEADGALTMHVSVSREDGVQWELLPHEHADVRALLKLADEAARCTEAPELFVARAALRELVKED